MEKTTVGIFPLIFIAMMLIAGCTSGEGSVGEKMKIALTIAPQAEFAEAVAGDMADVIVMVPPGASPHSYEPTPSQLEEVGEASLYFKVGSGVEFETAWMDDIEGVNPGMKVVDCSEGIALMEMQEEEEEHEHEEGELHENEAEESGHMHAGTDPHIWTSPRNAEKMVENIYRALAEEDPENAAYYRANADSYIAELEELDSSISESLSGMENREFIVFHPAWGYFARDYGLTQLSIEEAGKDPTAQNMQYVIDQAKGHGIKVIFASPQFSTSSAGAVASEIGGRVVLIDPLDRNYLENMRNVAEAFAAASD